MIILCVLLCIAAISIMMCVAYKEGFEHTSLKVGELSSHYEKIFKKYGNNRNAASHRWSSYILKRSKHFTEDELYKLFSEFCPVSGSPISPNSRKPFGYVIKDERLQLPTKKQEATHSVYHCCWPCICDLADCGRVKNKTYKVKNKNGKGHSNVEFKMIVMHKNPCRHKKSGTLHPSAPGALCKDNKLHAADHIDGHPIIGMVQKTTDVMEIDSHGKCKQRQQNNYRSGMGKIFRDICEL